MKMTRRLLIFLFAGLLGLVGCGDDDDDTNATTDDDTETTGDAADGDLATYCEKSVEIETMLAGEPEVDFESATPEEISAALKEFVAPALPVADEIQAAVPEENRANVDVLVEALNTVAETGDFEAFDTPEVEAASDGDHEFGIAECDWQQVDVVAKNYEFEGIPDTLEAGITSFEFRNDGTELHELLLLRKKDGVEESFDDLLALPEEEAQTKVDMAGSSFGAPGDEEYAIVDLAPGDYMAICFIPVGTVDEETEADGPPHFTQGMKTEFSVS